MEQVSSEARGWKDLGHLDCDHDAVADHAWQHKSVSEFLLDFGKGGSSKHRGPPHASPWARGHTNHLRGFQVARDAWDHARDSPRDRSDGVKSLLCLWHSVLGYSSGRQGLLQGCFAAGSRRCGPRQCYPGGETLSKRRQTPGHT